jgi:hypothetical protein
LEESLHFTDNQVGEEDVKLEHLRQTWRLSGIKPSWQNFIRNMKMLLDQLKVIMHRPSACNLIPKKYSGC